MTDMTDDERAEIERLSKTPDADLTPADREVLFRYEQWMAANGGEVFAGMTGPAPPADLHVHRVLTHEWHTATVRDEKKPGDSRHEIARRGAAARGITGGRLTLASDEKIHEAIAAVYDKDVAAGRTPPNLKQTATPVLKQLAAWGLSTSGNRIETLAKDLRHSGKRGKVGKRAKRDL
jgi:hypothetical protein